MNASKTLGTLNSEYCKIIVNREPESYTWILLPQLEMPLVAGEHRASATAQVTRLADNQHVGSMQVTQVTRAGAGPAIHSTLGNFENAVSVETVRSLHTPEGRIELSTVVVLVPGIGEIRSDGAASGATAVHRELACATIGGRSLGNCRDLNTRVEELRKAGSPAAP